MIPLARPSTYRAIAAAATVMSMAGCSQGPPASTGSGQEQADSAAGGGSGAGADGAAASDPATSVADGSGAAIATGDGDAGARADSGGIPSDGPDASDAGTDADADAGALCTTSAAKGSCGPYLYPAITGSDGTDTTVGNNVWNPISGWSQTLYAAGPGSWHVTASLPAGNTAVVSFPNTGESYDASPLTGFSTLTSSFSETMNPRAGTSAEAAYDIWLNDWNNEVMIQHDMVNRGGPCGPVLATETFGGKGGVPVASWILCQYGSEIIWQVSGAGDVYGVHSGSVDVLAMLDWLVENGGYLPAGSTLTAIGYGFEICSTGGADEDLQVEGFSISSSP